MRREADCRVSVAPLHSGGPIPRGGNVACMKSLTAQNRAAVLPRILLSLIFLAGAVLRIWNLGRHSLWLDEAWLALSVSSERLHDVIFRGPEDVPNSTPYMLSVAIHFVVRWFGNNEWTLRLLPAIFSTAAILVAYRLGRRLGGAAAGLLAATLMAFNPQAIYYGKELKQYAGDLFWLLLTYEAAVAYMDRPNARRLLGLIVVGIVGLTFSHILLIIAPGLIVLTWWSVLRGATDGPANEPRMTAAHASILSLAWAVAFGATWWFVLRRQSSPGLVSFWSEFFPAAATPTAAWDHLMREFPRYFQWLFGEWRFWAFACYAVGLRALRIRHRQRAWCLWIVPWVVTLLLATFKKYPMGAVRIDLFTLDLTIIPIACGAACVLAYAATLVSKLGRIHSESGFRRLAEAVSCIAVLALTVAMALPAIRKERFDPKGEQDLRPLMQRYLRDSLPQDATLLLDGRTHYAYRYYTMNTGRRFSAIFRGPHDAPGIMAFLRQHVRPGQRVWLPNAVGYQQNLEPAYEAIARQWPGTQIFRERGADLVVATRPADESDPPTSDLRP